jgi:DNA-binding GntR family transcriptional regulator
MGNQSSLEGAPLLSMSGQVTAPTLVDLAASAIRKKILAGTLQPGEQLREEPLTEELGVSRAPLREAFRVLESEGLLSTRARRGSFVATLTEQDVFEIMTLRSALERMAFELGIPVRDPKLLIPARAAVEEMGRCAREKDRGALVLAGYAFHFALIGIANHRRLEATYASVQNQLLVCMSRNLIVRERYYEDLEEHVERHRVLLKLVESGDSAAALAELAAHGAYSFRDVPASE